MTAAGEVETVRVELASRSYDIIIGEGLLAHAGDYLAAVLTRPRVVIVTDKNVAGLHLAPLRASLDRAGIANDAIIVPPGEGSKNFSQLEALLDQLLALRVERRDTIVALGGGVVGDLTGFAAAILRRGVDFIQLPTTLLAQVDSSVGGKTGIDTRHGKNLVGAFYQPRLVIAEVDLPGIAMDSRAYDGNVLFSLGPDTEFGGANDTPCHLDLPMKNCSLWLDDELIVSRGEVLPEDMRAPGN